LAQAEAVLDVIQAQNEASLRLAVAGLGGRLSEPIRKVYRDIMQVQAYLTACIDFPEDEVERQIDINPRACLDEAQRQLEELLKSAEAGMVYRYGVRTAIVGRPNVGKSSLLNRLLGEERAIVTDIPGTTRDTVEEVVTVKGIPFHLIDTAGIQDTADVVEHIGIQRSRKAIEQADLVLLVMDANAPLSVADRDVMELCRGKALVTIANKSDLPVRLDFEQLPSPAVRVSALTGTGIEALYDALAEAALGGTIVPSDAVLVTNPRHKAALESALTHLRTAEHSLAEGTPEDFVTIDLAACLNCLGQITGENASEELLETIFRQFCIGK
ncbi:MAG: tRNA modification GTPase MnmE, partial [Dehalococcoidia bacterium]|nr:tRNA modification GTPase MnmE [Dehalococcoidia bacterium]